jgi:hypothetical protein
MKRSAHPALEPALRRELRKLAGGSHRALNYSGTTRSTFPTPRTTCTTPFGELALWAEDLLDADAEEEP